MMIPGSRWSIWSTRYEYSFHENFCRNKNIFRSGLIGPLGPPGKDGENGDDGEVKSDPFSFLINFCKMF